MLHASKRNWLLVALGNLVVVAFLGLLLRWQFVAPLAGINYKFFLHGHSHVALLGWLYSALFVALLHAWMPPEVQQKRVYAWQFWLSQGAVAGMLVSFPLQGYALFSITFSTLHILLSYWFIFQFLRDAKALKISRGQQQVSFRFIRAALFFMALSSLGPWAMGPIMATGHNGDSLYYNAIYFYLHFQYNGWFMFAVLGLLFWLLEKYKLDFNRSLAIAFFWWMFWACLPAYLLSVLWTKPPALLYLLGGAAAFAQVIGLVVLLRLLLPLRTAVPGSGNSWTRRLWLLSGLAFVLKILMQFATAFPYVANLAYQQRNFVIGYLHLVLLGFISLFVLAFFVQQGWLSFKSWQSRWGMGLFVAALISSEALLFLQGIFFWAGSGLIPHYFGLLFLISVALPLGIVLFYLAQFSGRKSIRLPLTPELQHSQV